MRKLILIVAMSLLASQAHAGGSRSLSLAASTSNQPANEQPAAPAAGTPQAVQSAAAAQPAPTQTATTTSTSPAAPAPTAATAASAEPSPAATKPKRRAPSVEARVIRELHRHGIYW
ncbi:hypothetical protein [Bradyrhizobium sp. 195]|uniref:hypothetical protein n=1 Tax=Bradyrhizobium sp. 195 TaxID=2782662 RepID=UPI002001A809|nr:hypothetical protein [Bradyrhizobium sp. 195]UPK27434.1 hypothetical protein IVB26_02085 [Bradyrhizobium sp. 195]